MCEFSKSRAHITGALVGDFIMHRVELLIWHCAEFTTYHGNIRLVPLS
jgi:hypothetical protein